MAHMIDPLTPKLRLYTLALVFGSGGDVTATRGKNLVSISQTANGVYTLTFDRVWKSLVSLALGELEATASLGAWKVTAVDPDAVGGATIELTHLADTGSAAVPVSGDEVYLTIFATTGGSAEKTYTTYSDDV